MFRYLRIFTITLILSLAGSLLFVTGPLSFRPGIDCIAGCSNQTGWPLAYMFKSGGGINDPTVATHPQFVYSSLIIDVVFWAAIAFIAALLFELLLKIFWKILKSKPKESPAV